MKETVTNFQNNSKIKDLLFCFGCKKTTYYVEISNNWEVLWFLF